MGDDSDVVEVVGVVDVAPIEAYRRPARRSRVYPHDQVRVVKTGSEFVRATSSGAVEFVANRFRGLDGIGQLPFLTTGPEAARPRKLRGPRRFSPGYVRR